MAQGFLPRYAGSHGDTSQAAAPSCSFRPASDINAPPGLPGRPGSKGEPGVGQKGDKGEQGPSSSNTKKITRIEETLLEIQKNTSKLHEDVVTLMSIAVALASKRSRNCDDLFNLGVRENGIYGILVDKKIIQTYCEFDRDGYNWMVFQRRINGEVDFYLNWTSYVNGFGNKSGEFWLGLQALHEITTSGSYRLRVDLKDWDGNSSYAEYSSFSIGNQNSNYRLNVSGYNGTAGDPLTEQNNGQAFSTQDRDNDRHITDNCAVNFDGAWWYKGCGFSNLNGRYYDEAGLIRFKGITWFDWKESWYTMKRASMKIRPNN